MKKAVILLLLCACSGGREADKPRESVSASKEAVDVAEEIRPKMGRVSFMLPKGWKLSRVQPPQQKDVESISFIRKVDEKLWENPGPLGTSMLPTMNIMISLRPENAPRDDIEPSKLSKQLIKQRVITELVHADEIKIDGLAATRIVGDTPDQGRIWIVLLAHGGYLYKWTLYGASAKDADAHKGIELLLSTVKVNR